MMKAVIWAATDCPSLLGQTGRYTPPRFAQLIGGAGCHFYPCQDLFKLSLLFFSTFEAIYF